MGVERWLSRPGPYDLWTGKDSKTAESRKNTK